MTRTMTFVTRRNCSLCDEALERLQPWVDRLGLVVDERDVDADPSLFEEFSIRVPVVLGPSGHVFAEGRIGPMAAAIAAFRVRFDAS